MILVLRMRRNTINSTSGFLADVCVTDVGQCQQCYIRAGHVKKCGDSRWNRFAISSRSKVMLTRLFGIRHLEIRTSLDMSRDQFY